MGVRGFVIGVFDTGPETVYECRTCGTTLESAEETCPYCGPTDVVEFDLRG
jgi:rubrerythrin